MIEVLLLAGAAFVDYASNAECVALNRRLAALAERHGEVESAARAYARLAISHLDAGDFAAWNQAVARSIELSHPVTLPRLRWRPLLLHSMRALALGDVATSERSVREAERLAAIIDDPALALSLIAHVTAAARLMHRDAEMLRALEDLGGIPGDVVGRELITGFVRVGTFARLEDAPRVQAELTRLGPAARRLEEGFFLNLLVEAYSLVDAREECERLLELFRDQPYTQLSGGHVQMTYEGPLARARGLLEAALGRYDAAEQRLEDALTVVSEQGFRPWVAQLNYDLGTVLQRAGRGGRARDAFLRARELAVELPMPGLVGRASKRLVQLGASDATAPAPSGPTVRATLQLRHEGETWELRFDGRSIRLKDSRGLQLLARLVEHAGQEIHVLALASDDPGSSLQDRGASDALDARAKREYQERLSELTSELARAEDDHDRGRAERLRRELEALRAELSRTVGLGGRGRSAGPAERARVNVQRRLKDALARITELDPACGRFLERSVRTGNYCVFLG